MAPWETHDECAAGLGAGSLSTSRDTPRRTPSGASRDSSRSSATPPGRGPSPPRMADQRGDKPSRDVAINESISILDPRRFTPTLHANLVSEILTLRRDQEEKTKQIDSLESALYAAREEKEQLQDSLTNANKDSRSLKRQLSLLEGGASSALGDLVRERDEAVDSATETKKRLEAAQKKIRIQEDDSQRVHNLWAQEKDSWAEERRKLERRIHVAETRLKLVLDQVAAYEAAHHTDAAHGHAAHDSDGEDGRGNDAASVRTMSITSSIRHSILNGPWSGNGHSLADELNLDDDDDQTDIDGRESALSYYASPGRASRDGVSSRMHCRNQSLDSQWRPGSAARGRLFVNQPVIEVIEALEGKVEEGPREEDKDGQEEQTRPPAPKATYTDAAVQYSPPPSPKLAPAKPPTPDVAIRAKMAELESSPRGDSEIEANQRRKRVQVSRVLKIEPPKPVFKMVSSASQTVDEPLSPPKTPKTPLREATPPPGGRLASTVSSATQTEEQAQSTAATQTEEKAQNSATQTEEQGRSSATQTEEQGRSSATQTEEQAPQPRDRASRTPSPPPPPIPTISIQPPTSRPTTPRSPRLPQHFKHFGCQVNLSLPTSKTDAAAQTEGIQVDKRLALLPLHLQPSAISSRPTSPWGAEREKNFTPVPGRLPARNPRRLANASEPPSSPVPSHGEDDGELHDDDVRPPGFKAASVTRLRRFSSIFAGFDTASSDEMDEYGDGDMSDLEYRTALSAPRPPSRSGWTARRGILGTAATSPDEVEAKPSTGSRMKPVGSSEMYNSLGIADGEGQVKQVVRPSRTYEKAPAPPPPPSSLRRNGAMRKKAMIQSGIASHQGRGRSRSPSVAEPVYPPFPIPTRASSRKPPISASSPSDGQRSPTWADGWYRRASSRSLYRTHSIRKVRSAAALPRNYRYRRQGSRSPPPLSPSTEAPESPGLPPLPRNDITTPRNRDRGSSLYRGHRHELSTNTEITVNTDPASQSSGSQMAGVVDAIAQTMVGEWMLKYVRRRRSFGMPEGNGRDETSNDRHKRWVWLAPYERAILWSSKQPSSGSALLGKTGRKLSIQSVLDVKDDNPAPKVMPSVFNRSILILTPQRALKFTAVSAERHYLWLTALTFLAHTSHAVPPDIVASPHLQVRRHQRQPLPELEMSRTKFRRGGIRDSIRLAKGKSSASKKGPASVMSIPSVPPSRMGDMTSFRLAESSSATALSGFHSRELSVDAAEPPSIPRFIDRSGHGRKRSNTGGHVPPPLSFRGFSSFSGPGGAPASSAGSSDVYASQLSSAHSMAWNSEASAGVAPSAASRPGNFFDAIGTVRMEAFISPLALSPFGEYPDEEEELRQPTRRRSQDVRRRNSRGRNRDRQGSWSGWGRTMEEDYFRDDPFKGF